MSIYFCENHQSYVDDDYSPCFEFGKYLICADCASEITYHKSQIIPSNNQTIVHWMECGDLYADIKEEDMPKDCHVIDDTHKKVNP